MLFKYSYKLESSLDEPVYNWDARDWPDDAPIIRAHDLGPQRNGELFRYYAQHQPGRQVWYVDRLENRLTYGGVVKDLAAAARNAQGN